MNDYAGPILRFARTLGRAWRRSKDFRVLVYLVGLLLLGGTVFYSIVEGWSPLDAFYFSAPRSPPWGLGTWHRRRRSASSARCSTSSWVLAS
jgi:hypothetical protein